MSGNINSADKITSNEKLYNKNGYPSNSHKIEKNKNKKIIIIIISMLLFTIILGISLVLIKMYTKKKKHNEDPTENSEEKSYSPESNNLNDLKRIYLSHSSNYKDMNIEVLRKTNYDIYRNDLGEENEFNYAILLVSECITKESNCKEKEILDLSKNTNLRNLNTNEKKPICFFNLKDNYEIISIKCSNDFEKDYKTHLISDLSHIIYFLNMGKDNKNKRNEEKYSNFSYDSNSYYSIEKKIEEKDLKNSPLKYGVEITEKKGKFNKKQIITIEDNTENESINKENYKINLKKAINEIKFNKKENVKKTEEGLLDIYDDKTNNINFDNSNSFLNLNLDDIIEMNLNNKIENKNNSLPSCLNIQIGNKVINYCYLNQTLELKEIKNNFTELSNINKLENELKEKIKDNLESIIPNITNKYSLLIEDEKFKFNFESGNLIVNQKKLNENLEKEVKNSKEILSKIYEDLKTNKNNLLQSFINNEINEEKNKYKNEIILIINELVSNTKQLTNSLKTQDNIYTKISNYYSNFSISELINKSNNSFNNYYKDIKQIFNKKVKFFINNIRNNIPFLNEINNLIKEYNSDEFIEIKQILNNTNTYIKDYLEEKLINEENFISESDINTNEIEFNNSLNELSNIYSQNLNEETIGYTIDKTFDEIMISFKENFTNILIFLDKEKDKFPLNENILNDFLTEEEKSEIKNKANNIINEIKNKNENYLNKIQRDTNQLLNNKNELNLFIFNLSELCSNDILKELSESFEYTFNNFLNSIKKHTELLYNNFYNNISFIFDKSDKKVSEQFIKKFSDFKAYFNNIHNYINNLNFQEEYKNVFTYEINKIRVKLMNFKNELSNHNSELNISFINNHINIIENISERFEKIFLKKELKNDNQNELKKTLENIIKNIKEIDGKINSLKKYNTYQKSDFLKLNGNIHEYINIFNESYNDINFIDFKFSIDSDFKLFNNKLNSFYLIFNELINSYNSKLESLDIKKEEEINNNPEINEDLNSIQNKIESLLSEKYENELINNCYNYYKDNTNNKIGEILNNFIIRLNNSFNMAKDQINDNFKKFKSSIGEFGYLATIYESIVDQNITKNYFDLIINNQKNNFDYTISYYYNHLIKYIEYIHNYIINNLPQNENNSNLIIIEENKNIINNKFIDILTKIRNSKKESLNIQYQGYILQVPQTNFFKANVILSNNVLESRNILNERANELLSMNNKKENTEIALTSKLYLENSDLRKTINELYKTNIEDNNFIVLNNEKLKNIIIENLAFDKNNFINKLKIELIDLKSESANEFYKYKEKYEELFKEYIDNFFIKNIEEINNLFNNGLKNVKNKIEEINQNIIEILNKIIDYLLKEKDRIEKEEKAYNDDYSEIKKRIDNYKNEIISQIKTIIDNYTENLYNVILKEVYNDIIEKNLDEFLTEIKNYAKNLEEKKILSFSYKIGEEIENIINDKVNNYKELIKNFIIHKYKMNLIDIFNIEKIEKLINNTIYREFKNAFLPVLKKFSNNKSSNYNFNDEIINDIESTKNLKLNNIKNILSLNNQLNTNNLKYLSFNDIKDKLSEIKKDYDDFFSSKTLKESRELNIFLKNLIFYNFNDTLNNTISSFGNEFFERYIKYNEILKIKNFFNNIRYSLVETLLYYQIIYSFKGSKILPNDLLKKMKKLNNLEDILETHKNKILNQLEDIIINCKEEIKNDIINKYINEIKDSSSSIIEYFRDIKDIIEENINNITIKDFEESYDIILNNSLYENIIVKYTKIINEQTNSVKNIINEQRIDLEKKFEENKNNKNSEVDSVSSSLDKYYESIKQYDTFIYNNSKFGYNVNYSFIDEIFKESNMNNLIKKTKSIKEDKIKEINDNSNYLKNIKIQNFENEAKKNFSNLDNNIINIQKNIENSINSINNLEKKIRRLDIKLGLNNDDKYKEELENIISKNKDIILEELFDYSERNKNFTNNFKVFNQEIDKKINNLNNSFLKFQKLIEKGNYPDDIIENIKEAKDNYYKYLINSKKIFNDIISNLNNNTSVINDKLKDFKNRKLSYINQSFLNILIERDNIIQQKSNSINDPKNGTLYIKDAYVEYNLSQNDNNNNNLLVDLKFEDNNINKPKLEVNLKDKIPINITDIKIKYEAFYINVTINFEENKYIINRDDDTEERYFMKKENEPINLLLND